MPELQRLYNTMPSDPSFWNTAPTFSRRSLFEFEPISPRTAIPASHLCPPLENTTRSDHHFFCIVCERIVASQSLSHHITTSAALGDAFQYLQVHKSASCSCAPCAAVEQTISPTPKENAWPPELLTAMPSPQFPEPGWCEYSDSVPGCFVPAPTTRPSLVYSGWSCMPERGWYRARNSGDETTPTRIARCVPGSNQ